MLFYFLISKFLQTGHDLVGHPLLKRAVHSVHLRLRVYFPATVAYIFLFKGDPKFLGVKINFLLVAFEVLGSMSLDFNYVRSYAFSALIRSRVEATLGIYGELSLTGLPSVTSYLLKLLLIRPTLRLIMFTP